MPKLPYGQGVCKDQCHHKAVIGVLGLLNSKHDAIAPKKNDTLLQHCKYTNFVYSS